jgi:hypothetical protein
MEDKRKSYNSVKEHDGETYTGMAVGGKHEWTYPDGSWDETKVTPDRWRFTFTSLKRRKHSAPPDTGAENGTKFRWLVVALQDAKKVDENTYETVMQGAKFKVGYSRPRWKKWSYQYHQGCMEDIMIEFLKKMIAEIEEKKKKRGLEAFIGGQQDS